MTPVSFSTKTQQRPNRFGRAVLVGMIAMLGFSAGCSLPYDVNPQSITRALAYPAPATWGNSSKELDTSSSVKQYRTGDWSSAEFRSKSRQANRVNESYEESSYVHDQLFRLPEDSSSESTAHYSGDSISHNYQQQQRERFLKEYHDTIQVSEQRAKVVRLEHQRNQRKVVVPNSHQQNNIQSPAISGTQPVLRSNQPNTGLKSSNLFHRHGQVSKLNRQKPVSGGQQSVFSLPEAPQPFSTEVQRAARSLPPVTPFSLK